jgi:hypothetical protein
LKRKTIQLPVMEEELKVDLTVHNLSANLIEEFGLRVAEPYYHGSLATAIKDLMQRAVWDQEFVESRERQE